jgi:hypothetical protein
MADEYNLVMTTEEDMVTWECKDQHLTIDLTYVSGHLFQRLVYTERADDIQHNSDHWAIRTVQGVSAVAKEPTKRRNWKKTYEKVLKEALAIYLGTWQGAGWAGGPGGSYQGAYWTRPRHTKQCSNPTDSGADQTRGTSPHRGAGGT